MRLDEERSDGSVSPTTITNSLPLVASLIAEEKRSEWDEKGKAVYGDQWGDSVDGSIPMRDLFEMPEEEIRSLKIEAYNKVLHHNKQQEKVERIERETQRNKGEGMLERSDSNIPLTTIITYCSLITPHRCLLIADLLAFNSARQQALGYTARNPIMKVEDGFVDPSFVDPTTSLMNVRRKHKPVEGAQFHDPRFVSRTTTSRAQTNFDFRSDDPPPPAAPPTVIAPQSRQATSFPQPPPRQVERQAPGLSKPRPPSFAPPVPGPAPAPQVERQAAGLKNPKPPSFLPSTSADKYAVPPSPGNEVKGSEERRTGGASTITKRLSCARTITKRLSCARATSLLACARS